MPNKELIFSGFSLKMNILISHSSCDDASFKAAQMQHADRRDFRAGKTLFHEIHNGKTSPKIRNKRMRIELMVGDRFHMNAKCVLTNQPEN